MTNTRTFPITGHAASTIECYAEEVADWEEDAGLVALIHAFRAGGPYLTGAAPRKLVVTRAAALDVADGLCDLANGEDDMADHRRRDHPELAAMHRAGQRGLSSLRSRVLAWVR